MGNLCQSTVSLGVAWRYGSCRQSDYFRSQRSWKDFAALQLHLCWLTRTTAVEMLHQHRSRAWSWCQEPCGCPKESCPFPPGDRAQPCEAGGCCPGSLQTPEWVVSACSETAAWKGLRTLMVIVQLRAQLHWIRWCWGGVSQTDFVATEANLLPDSRS